MKLLTFLFAFYILLLPCIPCSDTGECDNNNESKILGLTTSDTETQHEEDACSPFCSCTCCGHSFTPNFQLAKIASVKPVAKLKQQFPYNNISLSSSFSGNIWQPPKV